MGKEKRKTRLEKGGGGGGDFVGFSAFAQPSTSDEPDHGPPVLKWSPVYTGSDPQLSLIFKKISQKRDGLTKSKALKELEDYFNNDTVIKKEQVAALLHLVFIYHSKLCYDDFASVRASSITTLTAAYSRIPKAWTSLVLEQHCEIWGMIWCAQRDASSDVKAAAKELCQSLPNNSFDGIQEYTRRILTYGRPTAMHDDLFSRKDENLSEMNKDQLDERFERITGTAIEGMELWIKQHPETNNDSYESLLTDCFLFKTLTSSKSSFRRKTYELLTTMCQNAKSLVYGPNGQSLLFKILPQVMSQEKDPANVSICFEVFILYLSSNGDDFALTLDAICKPLCKTLKKACYGASADQWGPSMLPLFVTMKNDRLSIPLIVCLWEGRTAAIGLADELAIATAVAESSSFFLLRREGDSEMEELPSKQLASIWIEVVKLYLSISRPPFQAIGAYEHLQQSIARDFFRLDNLSDNRTNCALHRIRNWFWDDQVPGIINDPKGSDSNFRFLQLLLGEHHTAGKDCKKMSRLHPIVRRTFHSVLETFQRSSGSVPKDNEYTILIESLCFCGTRYVFSVDDCISIDQFLINDLLRWIVIHTSTLSDWNQQDNQHLAERDAALFSLCLQAISSPVKQQSLWEAVFREIVMAKCDLAILSSCFVVLANVHLDVLKSESLELFAIQVGIDCSNQRRKLVDKIILGSGLESELESFEHSAHKTLDFLGMCAGFNPRIPHVLVGKRVITKWLDAATDVNDVRFDPSSALKNPLLETMVSIATTGNSLENDEILKIVLEAWREGNVVWKGTEAILSRNSEICDSLVSLGSKELSSGLKTICYTSSILGRAEATVWSQRARRLIDAQKMSPNQKCPSLLVVGLSDLSLWQSAAVGLINASALSTTLINILFLIESESERRSILLDADSTFPGLFVTILLAISSACGSKSCNERCTILLSVLGTSEDVGLDKIETWCNQVIINLASAIENCGIESGSFSIQNNVIVLSKLLSFFLWQGSSNADLGFVDDPTVVKEGQSLWYIVNAGDEHIREEAVVTKVHEDDYPRLFFTIRLQIDGDFQEKQTIPERLRTTSSIVPEVPYSDVEQATRSKYVAIIFDKIVKPSLTIPLNLKSIAVTKAGAACMNMVILQCGVFGKGGLGSFKYECFQLLNSLQKYAIQKLSTDCMDEACLVLESLSLCMGNGSQTPSHRICFDLTKFDPECSVKEVIKHRLNVHGNYALNRAVLEWLVLAVPVIKNQELREDAFALQLACSAKLLSFEKPALHLSDYLLTMKGHRTLRNMSLGPFNTDDETVLCTEIIWAFCDEWSTTQSSKWEADDLHQPPAWYVPLCTFVTSLIAKGRQSIAHGAKNNAERLIIALKNPTKRWVAFLLLIEVARMHITLTNLDYINDGTRARLVHWKADLVLQVDADELEADVAIVSQWLPASLMNDVENWAENDLDVDVKSIDRLVIGRVLAWLSVLQYLESAAADDIRNRGAFSSYIKKCNAVVSILNILLEYLPINEGRLSKEFTTTSIEDVLKDEKNIEITKLSSLALFRTVEVFPTLTKHWWEEDCPKSLTSALSQFVQTKVAPETLRRELRRISAATNLGEMTVSGSIVSREVVARYTQDECQLSVLVSLPLNFPLRNVEVDGTKTLGVPEKRWKRWALQIRMMLNSQDGTLLDAFMLWKENVDKEFEGVEPCPVCYSVLSVKTHELPSLQCKTCNHCFHSSCLYKWFKSSGKSQCVLCQQPWSGHKLQ